MAAAFAGATIQGAIGFGINLVTVPVIAIVAPEALPATVVILGLPISIAMMRHEFHAIERRAVVWVMVGRTPFSIVGAWIVTQLATESLAVLVGLFVLFAVLISIAAPPIPVNPGTQMAAGAVSGITGTAAGIGGPPIALLYQHHPGPTMRGTLAATFFFGTLLSIATLSMVGEIHRADIVLALYMFPFVIAGTLLARRFLAVLDRGWLRPAVLVFAAVSALVAIIDAL